MTCREIRKEMINYCEDEESSSTDEEDLCRYRPTLRNRKSKINYNENALIANTDQDSNEAVAEEQQRPREKIRYIKLHRFSPEIL